MAKKATYSLGALGKSFPKKAKQTIGEPIPQSSGEASTVKDSKTEIEPNVSSPKPPKKAEKVPKPRSKVKSISLYESDFDNIDEIRAILFKIERGNFNDSTIIRAALKLCSREPEALAAALVELRQEDGRRR